ncbi:hypothetical protein HPB47_004881 [Ixodes persulcatus]|uniref:Uncharacterized protein n=1 Tax=Ixodes persulcatus TaxID=34615 RepID=A0AC60PEJ0_IXOPE|nr:hypothetical protein HPB47_004881 [Ixodes persulcatus]
MTFGFFQDCLSFVGREQLGVLHCSLVRSMRAHFDGIVLIAGTIVYASVRNFIPLEVPFYDW